MTFDLVRRPQGETSSPSLHLSIFSENKVSVILPVNTAVHFNYLPRLPLYSCILWGMANESPDSQPFPSQKSILHPQSFINFKVGSLTL